MIELLLVMVIGLIVIGLPLTLAVSSFVQQNKSTSRAASATRAQLGLDRFMRDLRQATSASIPPQQSPAVAVAVLTIPTARANSLAAIPPPTAVRWTCTTTCTRKVGVAAAETVVSGVTFATFTPTFSGSATLPSRVDVELRSAVLDNARGDRRTVENTQPVTYRAGVDLRNRG